MEAQRTPEHRRLEGERDNHKFGLGLCSTRLDSMFFFVGGGKR